MLGRKMDLDGRGCLSQSASVDGMGRHLTLPKEADRRGF